MARVMEPTAEQEACYREWVASRPAAVRAVAERFDPWSLYRLTGGGQRVTVASFGEGNDSVTLTVLVSARYNRVLFERHVFGVPPDDLEPCELPDVDEPLGALFSHDEADEHIDVIRVLVRPDLWELDPTTGTAIRKPTH